MASCDEELGALREAIALGVRKIVTQTNGVRKEIEYASFKDMRERIEWLEAQCKPTRRPRGVLASF